MFLQYIRSDAALVVEVFGEERETTAQSILAAQKWRSMTDEERKVSFAFTLFTLFRSSVSRVFSALSPSSPFPY